MPAKSCQKGEPITTSYFCLPPTLYIGVGIVLVFSHRALKVSLELEKHILTG